MRQITEMVKVPPVFEITHYTVHKGIAVFFYHGYEPNETGEYDGKYIVGWYSRFENNDKTWGDFVTLVTVDNEDKNVKEAIEILYDQAVSSIDGYLAKKV